MDPFAVGDLGKVDRPRAPPWTQTIMAGEMGLLPKPTHRPGGHHCSVLRLGIILLEHHFVYAERVPLDVLGEVVH